jgi:hypothetical protein
LTFAAGVLIAVGRTLEPFYSAADDWSYVLTLAICFIAMGLTSVWAMLGRRHVAARCLVTFAIAMLVGMIPWWIDRDAELWLWIPIMLFQTACLLGSLGVVRILGWRLIRRRLATTDGREPTEEADLQVIASEK